MIDAKKNIADHNKMRNHLNEHVETLITYYAYMHVNCARVIYDENCQMGNMYALKRQSCFLYNFLFSSECNNLASDKHCINHKC